jgi:3-oxoadipate enol-lactonase
LSQHLVLLHGIGGAARAFAPTLPGFKQRGLTAIGWDQPGYGGTASIEPYEFSALARELAHWLDAQRIDQATLVGHSMGGMIALEFYAAFPQRVRAMVLGLTSPAFGGAAGDFQKQFVQSRIAPLDAGRTMRDIALGLVPNMLGRGSRAGLRRLPTKDGKPGAWIIDDESKIVPGARFALEIMSAVPPATYRLAINALAQFDRRALLPTIAVPTLCLAGEDDTTAAPSVVQKMAAKIPGARFEVMPGIGHLGPVESPESFVAAVVRFVQALGVYR